MRTSNQTKKASLLLQVSTAEPRQHVRYCPMQQRGFLGQGHRVDPPSREHVCCQTVRLITVFFSGVLKRAMRRWYVEMTQSPRHRRQKATQSYRSAKKVDSLCGRLSGWL